MLGSRSILYASKIPPSILTQPSNVTTLTNTITTFTVSCIGPDLKYTWYISNIPTVTENIFNVGAYTSVPATSTVYVVVSNRFGSLTSNNVTLTVNMPPFNIAPDLEIGGPGLPGGVTNFNFDDITPSVGKIPKTDSSIPWKAYCYANGSNSLAPFTFEFYIGTTKITNVSPVVSFDIGKYKYYATLDLSDPKLRTGTQSRPTYNIVNDNLKCIITDKFGRKLTSNIVNYSNYGPPWAIAYTSYTASTKFVKWSVTNTSSTKCNPTSFIVLDSDYPNGNLIQSSTDIGNNAITLNSKSPTGSTRKIYVTDGISVSNPITITV